MGLRSVLIQDQAWIIDFHQHLLGLTDPWLEGYWMAATWPMLKIK